MADRLLELSEIIRKWDSATTKIFSSSLGC